MNKENKKSGFILLHRSIRKHWLWDDATRLQAWLDILLEANHADKKVLIGNNTILCKRGESIKSLGTWAKRWGWNKSSVVRFFKLLEKEHMIVSKPQRKTKHISICNYESYQSLRNSSETQMKLKGNSNETQMKPNNEDNEVNETNIGKNKEPSKLTLPYDSEKFINAWYDWTNYRVEIKKPLTKTAITRQINILKTMSEDVAIQSIEKSITNGWRSIYPPKGEQKMTTQQQDAWDRIL